MRKITQLGASLVAGLVGAALMVPVSAQFGWFMQDGAAILRTSSANAAASIQQSGTGPILSLYGPGTQAISAAGTLYTSTASASNGTTVETDLISYAMPANTLSTNGQKVRITAWGTHAANGNTKTIRLYFGATQIAGRAAADNGSVWRLEADVVRTGTGAQTYLSKIFLTTSIANTAATTASVDVTAAVTIKVTGQSGTASNDVTALGMYVEWLPG